MTSRRQVGRLLAIALGALLLASVAPSVAAVEPGVALQVSSAPTSGQPVTITPVFTGIAPGPNDLCRWEFRWGSTSSLDAGIADETFGGLLFDVPAADGGCGAWTLTLPWVPYPQFDVWFDAIQREPDGGSLQYAHAQKRFMATLDSTERRILSSTLPIAQVLPNTYTPVVGSPVTYTLYLLGGASTCCAPRWVARLGNGENPIVWETHGGSTFTLTPPTTGPLLVGWDTASADGLLMSGYYDPPVRSPDTTRPTTTVPSQRVRTMAAGDTIPIAVAWSGSDKGWGVKAYQLQQSVNGGAWAYVHLPSASTTSIGLTGAPGSAVRYRVRAIDKAGNYGYWTYGPTFAVQRLTDGSSASRYTTGAWSVVANAKALNGSLHATTKAGAATSITFTGRDVGWIAEKGPGHGLAKVYLDGVSIGSIDLGATTTQPRVIVFARHFSSVGTHVLRIVNVATIGRPMIDVDGIAVLH